MPNELDDVKVGAIAVTPPHTVSMEMPVAKAAEKMLREKIHSVVIVDKTGKPKGMVSAWDILKVTFLSESSAKELPLSKLIENQKMIFVYNEVSIRDALNLLINKGIQSMPVLDESDNLVGKISLTNISKFVKEKL